MEGKLPKILVAESIAEDAIDILKTAGEVDIRKGLPPDELKRILPQYDALVVRSQTKVTADLLEAATRLQIIGRPGVGVDNIDVNTASKRGIVVVNSPLGNTISTAEHAIALLLSLVRQIPMAHAELKAGTWNRSRKGIEVRNKTLGVVGLGKIGSQVAEMARGLKMNVIAYDPFVSQEWADRSGVTMVELDNLLRQSDFVTLHLPLTPNTEKIINAEKIGLMKHTAMLVNCARGKLVDEQALYDALEKGAIAGAAIDVYSVEPTTDNVLIKSEKVVVTPHLAASTVEAERGEDMGTAFNFPKPKTAGESEKELLKVLRKANLHDVTMNSENQLRRKTAFDFCLRKIDELQLPMKLTDVEYQLDRKKIIFFFTAEDRVDFRELVKILASEYKTRIEMRQISTREETRRVGGIGPCGKEICCHQFIDDFEPVSTQMVKEQNLPMNPSKISGLCGKLKCCFRYEHALYKEILEKYKGEIVETMPQVLSPEDLREIPSEEIAIFPSPATSSRRASKTLSSTSPMRAWISSLET